MSTIDIETLIENKINEKIITLIDNAINKTFSSSKDSENSYDESICTIEKTINHNDTLFTKADVKKHFDDMSNALDYVKNRKYIGEFQLDKNVENYSEEDKMFVKYLATLDWNKLQDLTMNNAKICIKGLYNDETLIIPEVGSPIDAYYNIIKNTLYDKLSKMINIEYKVFNHDILTDFLLKEFGESMDSLLDRIILKYNKEIFDYLFGKIYLVK